MKFASWILRLVAAVILLQTLFFKFTGAEESVYIFTTVGAEPWGRYGSGVIELIAAALLLIPNTAVYGALLTVGVAAGAILSHLTLLGIDVKGDGGLLFGLAVTILLCGLALVAIHRRDLPVLKRVLEV
jgi:putative oxidoreductase